MKNWPQKSFELVDKGGYLDRLSEIYPAPVAQFRELTKEEILKIKEVLGTGDAAIMKYFLGYEKFPINDPYISFIRYRPTEIKKSPKTIKRICDRLREMGPEKVVAGLTEPKQFNRQMGAMFKNWLENKYASTDDIDYFMSEKSKIIFLGLSEEELRKFCNDLGCGFKNALILWLKPLLKL